jgi:hypothetical protein
MDVRRLLFTALFVAGCSPIIPPAGEVLVGSPDGVYSDAEIRALAVHDIDQTSRSAKHVLDVACLAVVPSGESRPRGEVFRTLGLDDRRLRDFRLGSSENVDFLWWRVSPSYDIVCMTAANDPANNGLGGADPKRKVYGSDWWPGPVGCTCNSR